MPYCTAEQVADEFNGLTFSASTNPNTTTVERWIAEADALINAKVGLRYAVPIDNATDLIVIRQIAIALVAARVRRRLNRTGPEGETAKVKAADTESMAMKMLDQIALNKGINLENSTLLNSTGGVSSFTTSECVPHKFRRDCDDW